MSELLHPIFKTFYSPLLDPWSAEQINWRLEQYGGTLNPDLAVRQSSLDVTRSCYTDSGRRIFHGLGHGGDMGQPYVPPDLQAQLSGREGLDWYAAVLTRAGLKHDAGYPNVDGCFQPDRDAWPPALREQIGQVANYQLVEEANSPLYHTYLTRAGEIDEVTRMVAQVFGLNPESSITHTQGGNEFISALFAAKQLEQEGNKSPKFILAVTAAIEATRPFLSAMKLDAQGNVLDDGRMKALADRVKATRLTLGGVTYQPDWIDVNDMLLLAVHMANRDISSLCRTGNALKVIDNGRQLRAEDKLIAKNPALLELLAYARPDQSAPKLYSLLREDSSNVPHVYIPRTAAGQLPADARGHLYPSWDAYQAMRQGSQGNALLARAFFEAYGLGPLVAAAMGVCAVGPQVRAAEFVSSALWPADLPVHRHTHKPFTELENVVQRALGGEGQHDINSSTPQSSPISRLIHAASGSEGTHHLNTVANRLYTEAPKSVEPFARPAFAGVLLKEVISTIGRDNFDILVRQQCRVTERRAPADQVERRVRALHTLASDVMAGRIN